jgi:protocatechuate 3,4-dioxygenase beta subunit
MSIEVTETYIARDRSIHPPAYAPDYKTSVLRSPRKGAEADRGR